MARDKGVLRLTNPWPRFAWLAGAAIVGISLALGFLVLDRYQQNDPHWVYGARSAGVSALPQILARRERLHRRCALRRV